MRRLVRLSLLVAAAVSVGACTSGSDGADSSQTSSAVAVYATSDESHPGYLIAYQRCRQTDSLARLAKDELHLTNVTPEALADAYSKTFPPELQVDAAAGCLDGVTGQPSQYVSDATGYRSL